MMLNLFSFRIVLVLCFIYSSSRCSCNVIKKTNKMVAKQKKLKSFFKLRIGMELVRRFVVCYRVCEPNVVFVDLVAEKKTRLNLLETHCSESYLSFDA